VVLSHQGVADFHLDLQHLVGHRQCFAAAACASFWILGIPINVEVLVPFVSETLYHFHSASWADSSLVKYNLLA